MYLVHQLRSNLAQRDCNTLFAAYLTLSIYNGEMVRGDAVLMSTQIWVLGALTFRVLLKSFFGSKSLNQFTISDKS